MATTTKGYRYPVGADPVNVPLDIQRLAEDVDASPGIAVLTTAQRNALAGGSLWAGRMIFNSSLGYHETYNGAQWQEQLDADHTAAADPHGQYVLESTAGAASGLGTLDANSRQPIAQHPRRPYRATAASGALTVAADRFGVVDVDASGGARTMTLPTAVGITGEELSVRKSDSSSNAVTVDPNGAETINGVSTFALAAQYELVTLMSNGANWVIL